MTTRYRALLRELADDPGELHGQFVMALVSGDRAPLEAWLDARHGPGCLARLFRAPSFGAGTGQVMPQRAARPRSSGPVRPVTSSPETMSRIAGRAWVSSGAARSAASRALTHSSRRPQFP